MMYGSDTGMTPTETWAHAPLGARRDVDDVAVLQHGALGGHFALHSVVIARPVLERHAQLARGLVKPLVVLQ